MAAMQLSMVITQIFFWNEIVDSRAPLLEVREKKLLFKILLDSQGEYRRMNGIPQNKLDGLSSKHRPH